MLSFRQINRDVCSIDTPENYRESVRHQVGVDAEVDRSKHEEVEKVLNAYSVSWTRILAAGQFIGHKDQIQII